MKRSLALIGILAIMLLSGCASQRNLQRTEAPAAPPQEGFGTGGAQPGFLDEASKASGEAPAPQAPSVANAVPQTTERLIIQNADLSIVVKDVNARVNDIQTMAKGMGGFIVSVSISQVYASSGRQVPQGQIVVRVPQEKLEEALTQIKKDTIDVQNETRSGTDVTDQYVDLQSRLKAKQAAEAQLLKIMEGATRTEDVLAVYAQLQQIQSDIEVLKGQIKFYEQSAALSAITVNIIAEETVQPIEVGPWQIGGVARDALQSLIYFWQDFAEFLVRFLLLILPALITIAIPLYLIFLLLRWVIRKTRRPKAVAPADEPKK